MALDGALPVAAPVVAEAADLGAVEVAVVEADLVDGAVEVFAVVVADVELAVRVVDEAAVRRARHLRAIDVELQPRGVVVRGGDVVPRVLFDAPRAALDVGGARGGGQFKGGLAVADVDRVRPWLLRDDALIRSCGVVGVHECCHGESFFWVEGFVERRVVRDTHVRAAPIELQSLAELPIQ